MQDQILTPPDQMLASCSPRSLQEQRPKQQAEQVLKCPRCDSLNTKFCYYNNYSLAQPRHFCKSCKRYWTKGGALRNVPVGGGCRKNKRSKQRRVDQASSPGAAAEEAALRLSAGCNLRSLDVSSLKSDFSAETLSPGSLYHQGDGVGLTFERLDSNMGSISATSAPMSAVKWAAQMSSLPAPSTHSSLLALNLSGHFKHSASDRLQDSCDLTCMQQPQFNMNIGAGPGPEQLSSINDNFPPFCLLDGYGDPNSNADLQWRLPPKLVSMMEETSGHPAAANHGKLQLLHGHAAAEDHELGCRENLRHELAAAKGKFPFECHMPKSSETDVEHGNQPSPPADWRSTTPADHAGLFELTGDPVCWTNGSTLPLEYLSMYHGAVTGSQLL